MFRQFPGKRLRDAPFVFPTVVFSFAFKKKMKVATRFPCTVEAYNAHLREDRPLYDSFQTFCRKQGVRYKGVMQWMRRHNRSVWRTGPLNSPVLTPARSGARSNGRRS